MTRIVKLSAAAPQPWGLKKARRKRKPDPEDYGQLNLFASAEQHTLVFSLGSSQDYFERALALDESGDPAAVDFYLKAAELGLSRDDAYCNLGIMKYQENAFAESVDYFTKSLEANPRHFEAHYNLANVYSELGNFALARLHYEVALQIDPSFQNGYYNLGLTLVSLKQYELAIDRLNHYLFLAPEADKQAASELIKTLKSLI